MRSTRLLCCALFLLFAVFSLRVVAVETPQNVIGTTSGDTATLSWSEVDGAAGYNVYRDNTYVTTVFDTTYSDALDSDQVAIYFIVAFSEEPVSFSAASEWITLPESALPDDLTIPPSVPQNLNGEITGTSVTLNWDASTDDESVAGYNVYQNSTYQATVFTTQWRGTVEAGERYLYSVVAFDIRENFSAQSQSLLLPRSTSGAEPRPPSVPTGLIGSYSEQGATASIELSWQPSEDDGLVIGYNVYQNNSYVDTVLTTQYTTEVPSGSSYSFSVVAFDNETLFSANSEQLFLPDSGEPVDTSIPPSVVTGLSGTFNQSSGAVVLSWDGATDDRGIAGYNVYEDNQYVTTVFETGYQYNTDPAANHEYYVVAFDIDGNFSAPSSKLFLPEGSDPGPDTEPPTAPANLTGELIGADADQLRLSWQPSTDNRAVSGYNVYENNQYLTTVFATTFEKPLQDSTVRSYYVVAFDNAGNFSTASSSVNVPDSGNQAPFIADLPDITAFAGETLSIDIAPTDVDGPAPGIFIGTLPEGMASDDNFDGTRTLRWRPLQPDVGTYTIEVTLFDAVDPSLQTNQSFQLTIELPDDPSSIENLPPVIDLIPPHVVRAGDTVVMEVKASDPNGTLPLLNLVDAPPGSTFETHPQFEEIKVLRWSTGLADAGTVELTFNAIDADDPTLEFNASTTLDIRDADQFVRAGERLKTLAEARNIKLGYASLLQFYNRPDGELYQSIAGEEFNLVTPENSMKWGYINPEPGQYRWEAADRLIAFADANNMTVHGHTLVWYASLPQWVQQSVLDDREQLMYEFIDVMTTRYSDVAIWDVVNETFEEDGSYRNSVWFQAMGTEYIKKAFDRARLNAPAAALIYNDYNISTPGPKSDAVYTLLESELAAGTPIDGIGFQMHIDTGFNQFDAVAERFATFAALGLDIYITELDVSILDGDTEEEQAQIFKSVTELCIAEPACKALQVWGITDRYSWLDEFNPLLLDRSYQPKAAYFAVQEALQ